MRFVWESHGQHLRGLLCSYALLQHPLHHLIELTGHPHEAAESVQHSPNLVHV